MNSKSKGQIEDQISKIATKYYQESLGIGPKETRVYILEDMIIVRFKGKLLPFEEKLLESKDGIHMVKHIRKTLVELFISNFSGKINEITGCKVISTHGDISTRTGEKFEVFVLDSDYGKTLTKGKNSG